MDRWRQSQGVEDGEEVKMLVGHSMQGRGASLIFLFLSFFFFFFFYLLTPGEIISEEYTLDYGKAMWEYG